MTLNVYLGIDVGSVTTKLALVDEKGKYIDSYMLKTAGKPVDAFFIHSNGYSWNFVFSIFIF